MPHKTVREHLSEIHDAAEAAGHLLIVIDLNSNLREAAEQALFAAIERRKVVVAAVGVREADLTNHMALRMAGLLHFSAWDVAPTPAEERSIERLRRFAGMPA